MSFLKFLGKSFVKGEWHFIDLINPAAAFTAGLIRSKMNWSYSIQRGGIQFVCDNSHDYETIFLSFLYLSRYPDAQKTLWHYLTGRGDDIEADTAQVLKEDAGVKGFVFGELSRALNTGKGSGSINVRQPVYKNENWKNAFGSINVKWIKLNSNSIQLWIEDTYKWHPDEQRPTQCVHQTLERAKLYGAMEFKVVGTRITVQLSDINNNSSLSIKPSKTP